MSDDGRSPSPRKENRDQSPRSPRDQSPRNSPRSRSPMSSKSNNNNEDVANPGNNLYVANLAHRITQPELEEMFAKFGRLEKCEVIIDPITRESRGFAFVTFEDLRDAEDSIKELNGKEIHGRRIRVEVAKRSRGHEKTPGKYLGPRLASSKYGRDGAGGRDRDRSRSRRRSRSRDRHSRRHDDRDRYDRRNDDRGRRRSYDRYDDRRSRR